MLSRVADSLYWMARYMERAENLSRLLVAHHHLRLDAGAAATANTDFWELLLMATGDDEGYRARHPVIAGPDVSRYLSLMEENPNSIRNCVRAARENARRQALAIANDLVRAYGMLDVKLNRTLLDNIMLLGLRHAIEPLDAENQPVRWELP